MRGSLLSFGSYQQAIFLLCGFGYFLDLCWAQAFGLVGSALQQELGVSGERCTSLLLLGFCASSNSLTDWDRSGYWRYYNSLQYRSYPRSLLMGNTGGYRRGQCSGRIYLDKLTEDSGDGVST